MTPAIALVGDYRETVIAHRAIPRALIPCSRSAVRGVVRYGLISVTAKL